MQRIKLTAILICLLIIPGLSLVAQGADYPAPTSSFYVNDFADILDYQTERYIISAAATLDNKTTAQLVVVTTSDVGDTALEDYSLGLFREWGIGSADKNNGVLILLDIGNRQSRIEVGYGLEGALPDGKTGRIQDEYMIPYYSQNDFNQGIRQGFNALLAEIYNEYGIDAESISGAEAPVQGTDGINIPTPLLIIGGIIIGILIILDFKFTGGVITIALLHIFLRSGRRGGGGGGFGGGGSAGGGGSSRRF